MKITAIGVLVVIAGVVLLGLIVLTVGRGTGETGKKTNEQPINPR
jgi:hypothetical protein